MVVEAMIDPAHDSFVHFHARSNPCEIGADTKNRYRHRNPSPFPSDTARRTGVFSDGSIMIPKFPWTAKSVSGKLVIAFKRSGDTGFDLSLVL